MSDREGYLRNRRSPCERILNLHNGGPVKTRFDAERRASRRLPVRGDARVLLTPARTFVAEAVDISESGVCLTSPIELAAGAWCHLQIRIPSLPGPEISVSGQVCFCIGHHGAYRVGVHCAQAESLAEAVERAKLGDRKS